MVFQAILIALGFQVGVSTFSIQHPKYPCAQLIDILKESKRPSIVLLWATFGLNPKCTKKVLSRQPSKPKTLEIHFSNESCRRLNRCKGGEFARGLNVNEYNQRLESKKILEKVKKRVLNIRKFVDKVATPETRVLLSTGLEDNLTPSAFLSLVAMIRQDWPYEIVRNPLHGAFRGSADFIESHIVREGITSPCIFNNDGDSFGVSEFRTAFTHYFSCQRFMWFPRAQGIVNPKVFISPRKRTFKFTIQDILTAKEIIKWAN